MLNFFKGGNKYPLIKSFGESEAWLENDFAEGQLSVDVYQTEKQIIIKSTIAGARPEDLHISLNNDLLTIKGKREISVDPEKIDYLYQECYWGPFSRSLFLPVSVASDEIEAYLENGVLTVALNKVDKPKKIDVKVRE